jgi:poly(beta-D-mannuronate) lyase
MRRSEILAALIIAVICHVPARADGIKMSFDPELSRRIAGKAAAGPFACRPAPEPMLDMSGLESRYVKNDPTQSKVDPAMAAREAARGKALWDFTNQLGRMADQYMLSNPPRPEIADCIINHLAGWARVAALTQNIGQNHEIGRHQAIMLQAWSLAGMTSAYMKLGNRRTDRSAEDRDVLHWFRILSDSVATEYSNQTSTWYRNRANNHGLWAGLAVANAGILLSDKRKVEFGLALLDHGLATVAANGSLPAEMARGERAMLYQHFGTIAIMGLVAIADANHRTLSDAQEQALERLVGFNIESTRKLIADSGLPPNQLPKPLDKSAFAWAEVAVCYFRERRPALAEQSEAFVRTMRPLGHIWLGGSTTAAFNPAALTPGTDSTHRCAAH